MLVVPKLYIMRVLFMMSS